MLDKRVAGGSVPSKAYNLMSMGIPTLYVAPASSQLARDAERFGHARCMDAGDLDDIARFVADMASRPRAFHGMAERAAVAAQFFSRSNADRFAALYFEADSST